MGSRSIVKKNGSSSARRGRRSVWVIAFAVALSFGWSSGAVAGPLEAVDLGWKNTAQPPDQWGGRRNPFTAQAAGGGSPADAGILPSLTTSFAGSQSGDDGSPQSPFGAAPGDSSTAMVGYSLPGPALVAELDGTSTASYANVFDKTFDTAGFQRLSAACLTDSAACLAVTAAMGHGLDMDRNRQAGLGGDVQTPMREQMQLALNQCIRKKIDEGLTSSDASNWCLEDQRFTLSQHPQAGGETTTTGDENTLRLSTLLFLSNADAASSSSTLLPAGDTGAENKKQTYTLTAGEFRSKFGDVELEGRHDKPNAFDQTLRILNPWDATGHNPQDYQSAATNPDELKLKCEQPVSLEFARYCWAYEYYQTIQWLVQAQCAYFNHNNFGAESHILPMAPRGGQGCSSSVGGSGSGDCPGPWAVDRERWEQARADLSFPGYSFGVGTAEAFFFAYRREVSSVPGGRGFFDFFGLGGGGLGGVISGLLGQRGDLSCDGANYDGNFEFTSVAQNWRRLRYPTWVAAAMRFANARALLFTRQVVIAAWGVIQQYTSSMGYKQLAEAARQLLVLAYDNNREQAVQKELERVAAILEQLEHQARVARTTQGGGVAGR